MSEFKKGDLVRSISGDWTNGRRGVVVVATDGDGVCGVSFERACGAGHSCDGLVFDASCWLITSNELTPAAYEVGDKVRFTDRCSTSWWFGPHTGYKDGVVEYHNDCAADYSVSVLGNCALAFVDSCHIELIIESTAPAVTPTPTEATAIVCKVVDGQPLPSIKPHVHDNADLATAEAERLSILHKGSVFGVYELKTSRVAEPYQQMVTKYKSVAA